MMYSLISSGVYTIPFSFFSSEEIRLSKQVTKGIFSFVGFNTCYLPYVPNERASGSSKWNPYKLLKYGLGGIISFSTTPLRFATLLGFVLSFLSEPPYLAFSLSACSLSNITISVPKIDIFI